jgi:hypothetical protein
MGHAPIQTVRKRTVWYDMPQFFYSPNCPLMPANDSVTNPDEHKSPCKTTKISCMETVCTQLISGLVMHSIEMG